MPLAAAVLHGHGQDRMHITGDGGFRHSKGARQPGSDAIAETLTPEVSGDLLSAQTSVKAAYAVIFAPPIRALTDLCPTGWRTPGVYHLLSRFCMSDILMHNSSPTR
jgi:hypothetical protein